MIELEDANDVEVFTLLREMRLAQYHLVQANVWFNSISRQTGEPENTIDELNDLIEDADEAVKILEDEMEGRTA